jgi:hypothetical protein
MSQDEELSPPQMKPGSDLNWDRIMALLAVVLSVTAILVSLFEVNSVRAHSRASVWPHLSIKAETGPDRIRMEVANKGVGPALIQDAAFLLDGTLVTDLQVAVVDTLGDTMSTDGTAYDVTDLENAVVAAGESVDYFSLDLSDESQALVSAWSDKADVELCYCSIQRDCWRTSFVSGVTVEVDSCSARGSTLSVSARISVSERDFAPITGQIWTGTLRYLDYNSGDPSEIPVQADVQSINDRTIVYRLIYPNETEYNASQRIRLSRDGTRIDGQPILSRERMEDGRLKIVTQGRSTDNLEPADIRMVYEIGTTAFDISQRVRPDGETEFFERNRYSFKR